MTLRPFFAADLNSLEHTFWGEIDTKDYATQHNNNESRKASIIASLNDFFVDIILNSFETLTIHFEAMIPLTAAVLGSRVQLCFANIL